MMCSNKDQQIFIQTEHQKMYEIFLAHLFQSTFLLHGSVVTAQDTALPFMWEGCPGILICLDASSVSFFWPVTKGILDIHL